MPPTIRYGLDCFSEASKSWTCECQRLNPPTRELFFLAPKYLCDCGKKFKRNFRISFDDIKINSYNLMGKIHYQTLSRCVAYAYVHALQVMERKEAILMKRDPSRLADLDPDELYEMLDSRFFDMTKVGCPMTPFRDVKMVHLGLILKEVGLIDHGLEPNFHRVGDVTVIPKDDFEGITTALARGEALVTTFYSGKRFNKLKYGQIYKSYRPSNYRSNKNKKIAGHAVCLVGAGREKGDEYLEFVNSHRRFCRRRNSRKKILMSGIGRIRASDLKSNVIRLSGVAADGEDEWRLKGSPGAVAPACAGSGEGSDHFGSLVHSLSLHFCKRLFPGLEPVTSWSQGSSFYRCAKAPLQLMNRLKPVQIGETLDIDKPSGMVDNLDIDDEMAAEGLDGCMKEPHDQVLVELKPHVPRDRQLRKGIKIRR